MIQLNLLPDVKQQFIKTRRTRRLITLVSLISTSVAVVIFLLLFVAANVWQASRIDSLSNNIATDLKKLQEGGDLNKILTIQNQLNALPELHASKVDSTRLLALLDTVSVEGVIMESRSLVFQEENIFEISGRSSSLELVNKFVDTLKFTEYRPLTKQQHDALTLTTDVPADAAEGEAEMTESAAETLVEKLQAFSNVRISSSSVEEDGLSFTYTIVGTFHTGLFDNTVDFIQLSVPQIITTRSEIEQPGAPNIREYLEVIL